MKAPKAFVEWICGPKSIDRIPSYTEAWWNAIYTAAIEASGLAALMDDSPCDHKRQSCADVGCIGPMTPQRAVERLTAMPALESRCRDLEAALAEARSLLDRLNNYAESPIVNTAIEVYGELLLKGKP